MLSLARKFTTVLSTPFGREGYRELAPCEALKPFVRCFWTEKQVADNILVIPDTCMDIVFHVGSNGAGSFFCALDECSFYSGNSGEELFGVRFYAWTAALFSRRSFAGSSGRAFHTGEFFDGTELIETAIQRAAVFEERVIAAELWLLDKLENIRADNDLLNAVDLITNARGTLEISELCARTAVSPRKLERVFARNIGISPKSFSSLVRYQMLWQEMIGGAGFDILDAVEKYGYTDQSHLLNDFRRRHLMTPKQALDYAKKRR